MEGTQDTLPSPAIALADLTQTQLVAIYNLGDLEAWDHSDEVLCGAALAVWPSLAYRHFTTTVDRHYQRTSGGMIVPNYIDFVFVCKYQPDKCRLRRKQSKTKDGTSNIRKAIKKCDKERMVPDSLATVPPESIPYSQLMFHALLVIWCVVSHRPFHTVADPLFLDIVHMLQPEAVVPTPHTLSSDLAYIYNLATVRIREVFLGMETGVHLAIDGWSSPLTASFLGVVVFWHTGSTMWRSVLECIHLTKSHTGSYLAKKTLECLDRFGLRNHVISVCLDNASNNNTLVQHLALSLPNFPGSEFRGRCMAHITNLAAKAFMAVFTRPPPKKRRIAQNARVLAQQSATSSSGSGSSIAANSTTESDLPPLDELDEALEIPGELIDEGMEQHDTVEVQKAVGVAIEEMANQFHLRLSDAELKEAREVFPKAAGFANQIHGSGTLCAMFTDVRNACKSSGLLNTEKEVPMQRVATRWGADAACANTHLELRPVVEAMTSRPRLKLSKFHSSSTQWDMLDECGKCLQIFEEATHVHSQTGVALIHQYLKLLEASDIYWLAIVLCPWYKIQWLEAHGYSLAHIDRVRRVLYNRFADYTVRFGPRPEPIAHGEAAPTQASNRPRRRFMQVPSTSVQPTVSQAIPLSSPLSIYLASPPVAEIKVQKVGGLVQYWENESNTPSGSILGKMALDILTAPSSSVDVERAFSGGRMAINYRQHRTSVGTFRAKMAVGSWFGTPLLSGVEEVYEMLDGKGSSEPPEPLD